MIVDELLIAFPFPARPGEVVQPLPGVWGVVTDELTRDEFLIELAAQRASAKNEDMGCLQGVVDSSLGTMTGAIVVPDTYKFFYRCKPL